MALDVDVLIIGAGGAGCRAAIAAADCGASVLMVSKAAPGRAGATAHPVAEMAGYNAGDPVVPQDVQRHYEDMVAAGQGMADEKLAAIVAAGAPATIKQLESWGVHFEQENGDYYIFKSCFSRSPRTHVIRGHGEPILKAMIEQIRLRPDIRVMDGITVMGLNVSGGACTGAYGFCRGEMIHIAAKAVVLATGGSGYIFERNMNPYDVTGDGYSMAYHAGASLTNMEFMQIGMGFSWPLENIFNGYIWEGTPKLRANDGGDIFDGVLPESLTVRDVMHEHRKHFPFSTSDCSKYLEIAVHKAVREGRGTEHRGVSIDLSHMTDGYIASLPDDCGIHHMWPIAREYMLSKGVDLLHDKIEVACYAHAVNGGVKIGADAMSDIEGLFAAGECAGGPHGADRLGGNMMVTCQVFGAIAGSKAAAYALRSVRGEADAESVSRMKEMESILYRQADTEEMFKRLKKETQDSLLVGRTEEGLRRLAETVRELSGELENSPAAEYPNERNVVLYHGLTAAALMCESARRRKESRGAHHRADYPEKSAEYEKPFTLHKSGGAPRIE